MSRTTTEDREIADLRAEVARLRQELDGVRRSGTIWVGPLGPPPFDLPSLTDEELLEVRRAVEAARQKTAGED